MIRFPLTSILIRQDELLAAGYPYHVSGDWPDPWRESARIDADRRRLGIPSYMGDSR